MARGPQLVSLITIRKMDRAIKFYGKAFGAKVIYRGEGSMKNYWASVKVAGAEVWFVGGGTREKRKLAYHTFVVKDIRKFVATLKKNGVKFEKPDRMSKDTKIEGPIALEPFGAAAFFKDPEGNLLMAWQSSPAM
jgi:predicted enzyme related to lactoylglutathione lyase